LLHPRLFIFRQRAGVARHFARRRLCAAGGYRIDPDAVRPELARKPAAGVEVEYEPLPAVIGIDAAIAVAQKSEQEQA